MAYPRTEYPPGSLQGEVEGVDLALTDGDVAAILYQYCEHGWLDEDAQAMLPHALEILDRVLPHLSDAGRSYFEPARDLLAAVSIVGRAT